MCNIHYKLVKNYGLCMAGNRKNSQTWWSYVRYCLTLSSSHSSSWSSQGYREPSSARACGSKQGPEQRTAVMAWRAANWCWSVLAVGFASGGLRPIEPAQPENKLNRLLLRSLFNRVWWVSTVYKKKFTMQKNNDIYIQISTLIVCFIDVILARM